MIRMKVPSFLWFAQYVLSHQHERINADWLFILKQFSLGPVELIWTLMINTLPEEEMPQTFKWI